ncbi:OLC1v1018866C1 [Oldenlandia corymbosa var. corymbosa]|uniref:OLC1v1018866C1 n=1 Tax=Oldenlandia corymbosa var. corymbosa TaxID=529605 RepID=A0AAV1ECQ9_OLDCO|nr:OLC1v1018866C1 [Oldenlandia corymbosa var. corymbosa]
MIEVGQCVALMKKKRAGIVIWRLISGGSGVTNENHELGEWEKIIHKPWPQRFLRHYHSDSRLFVRGAINNRENVVQILNKKNKKLYCYYWDIKEGKIKKAPEILQQQKQSIHHLYHVFSTLVETLFVPTIIPTVLPDLSYDSDGYSSSDDLIPWLLGQQLKFGVLEQHHGLLSQQQ